MLLSRVKNILSDALHELYGYSIDISPNDIILLDSRSRNSRM